MTTVAAKKVIHQLKHQLGIENKQCRAAQWAHFHQIQAGRYVQGMYVLTKLHNLYAARGHVGAASQEIKHIDARITGKALVNHFQRWHTPAHNAVVAAQVIGFYASGIDLFFRADVTVIYAVQ